MALSVDSPEEGLEWWQPAAPVSVSPPSPPDPSAHTPSAALISQGPDQSQQAGHGHSGLIQPLTLGLGF